MIEIVNVAARWVGYVVLASVGVIVIGWAWFKVSFQSQVSPEAKQMATEVDPNNPLRRAAAEMVFDGILESVRELQPDETIRAEPAPVTHFDWSVDTGTQEDIEHILSVLQDAGYYTHPLPDVKSYQDKGHWSRERAGVWRHEPDWYIVKFAEDGTKELREEVDLELPTEWVPKHDH